MKSDKLVSYKGFNEAIAGLQKVTGKKFGEILQAEAGMMLNSAIRKTPKATVKKIVKWTMPEGIKLRGGVGKRVVTYEDGKHYHVGIPVRAGQGKRGGQLYSKPYTYWMNTPNNRSKWDDYVKGQKEKVKRRVARRGMSAGQFAVMAAFLDLKLPKQPAKYLRSPTVERLVKPHIMGSYKRGKKLDYTVNLESKGLKATRGSGANRFLIDAAQARAKVFKQAVNKGWIKDIKKYMPKAYPLLFK